MIKNTLKKVVAVVCTATIIAQLAVFAPIANAAYINPDQSGIVLKEVVLANNDTQTTTTTTIASKNYSFVGINGSVPEYVVDFDLTLNGSFANGTATLSQSTPNSFAILPVTSAKIGPLFIINTATSSDVTFKWVTSNATSLTGSVQIGKKYNYKFKFHNVGNSLGAKIDLIITDPETKAEILNKTGLDCRNLTTGSDTNKYFTGLNFYYASSTEGTSAGYVVENLKTYTAGPDSITVKVSGINGGNEPSIASNTVSVPKLGASYTVTSAVASRAGVATTDAVTTSLVMADGSALPTGLSFSNGVISATSGLAGDTYNTKLVAYISGNEATPVTYPISFVKPQTTVQDLVDVYKGTVKVQSKDGSTLDITKIKDDVLLQTGNSQVGITWASSNSDVINTTGAVTPAREDAAVTLTATIGAKDSSKNVAEGTVLTPEDLADGKVIPATLTFDTTVIGASADITSAFDTLALKSTDSALVDLTNLSTDVVLPTTTASQYVTLAWASNSSQLKISKSNVAEIYATKVGETTATLTATATYTKNGKTYFDTREYPVSIKIDPTGVNGATPAPQLAVRLDSNTASDNFKDIPSGKVSTSLKNITLPTTGVFGTTINWTSSSPTVISNAGVVKPATNSTIVTLTATVYKNGATSQTVKLPTITVPAKATSGSSSSTGTTVTFTGNANVNSNTQNNTNTTVTTAPFTDLTTVAWAKASIDSLYLKGIVSGKTATTFSPNDNVTRAEFAKMVAKVFAIEDVAINVTTLSDVKAGDWYYSAVASAYNRGIITGYSNGSFGVNDNITRQDMAVIIYRASQVTAKPLGAVNAPVTFADEATIAGYAKDAVSTLQKSGIISGVSATEFAPTATATRAQAAKMLANFVK